MGEWTAIDDLIRRASDPAASAESLQEAIGPVFATFSPGDRAGAEAVLRRLAEEVVDARTIRRRHQSKGMGGGGPPSRTIRRIRSSGTASGSPHSCRARRSRSRR